MTEDSTTWRNIEVRRSRLLARHLTHTSSVHRFLARMAEQARSRGWQLRQMDPPHRAVRHFRHLNQLRSIHPDAFGVLHAEDKSIAFFLQLGTPGRAAGDDGGATGAVPPVLFRAPSRGRPWRRASGLHRLRRPFGRGPVPRRGAPGVGGCGGKGTPVGVLCGGPITGRTAGGGVAQPGPTGAKLCIPSSPTNHSHQGVGRYVSCWHFALQVRT